MHDLAGPYLQAGPCQHDPQAVQCYQQTQVIAYRQVQATPSGHLSSWKELSMHAVIGNADVEDAIVEDAENSQRTHPETTNGAHKA